MSYGTYDNQSPLNQPFNPTANTTGSNAVRGAVQMGTQYMGQKLGLLPGAQDPNQQQYFQQANESHQALGQALKNMQGGMGGLSKSMGGGQGGMGGLAKSMGGTPQQAQTQAQTDFFAGQ
jgi:hypothetical protein